MKLLRLYRQTELASVHVLACGPGPDGAERLVEAVESVQPPIPRDDKWVLIVSTLFGCPVGCAICDAGGEYAGRLDARQILAQIDHLVAARYPDGALPQRMLKIQFARMGEPALNPAVLEVLRALPSHLGTDAVLPSLSTVAPRGCERFLDELVGIKDALYPGGRFQLQFSVHTTDDAARRRLIPVRCWDLGAMARFGARFVASGDRRVTINFAAARELPVDPTIVARHFDPARFLVKLTPLNPTARARAAGLSSRIDPDDPSSGREIAEAFERLGFTTLVSIGEVEENAIGSNCGQFVTELRAGCPDVRRGYQSARYQKGLPSIRPGGI